MGIQKEKKLLINLLKTNQVIKFGKFTLSSGKKSDYYVDMKKAITNPQILLLVAKIITHMIQDHHIDKIAGPALGAVPIATAVAYTQNTHADDSQGSKRLWYVQTY